MRWEQGEQRQPCLDSRRHKSPLSSRGCVRFSNPRPEKSPWSNRGEMAAPAQPAWRQDGLARLRNPTGGPVVLTANSLHVYPC